MSILERLVGVVSPVECVGCGFEGETLCYGCRQRELAMAPERCFWCKKLSSDWRSCSSCRARSRLVSVFAPCDYSENIKSLIYRLKFDRQRTAVFSITELLIRGGASYLSALPREAGIIPVPTASSRIRERSFDHSKLLARQTSRACGREFVPVLRRSGQTRQVGATRKLRLQNLKDAFYVPKSLHSKVLGREFILIDDIVTTGATLECSARALKLAGAKSVYALVLAHKQLGE